MKRHPPGQRGLACPDWKVFNLQADGSAMFFTEVRLPEGASYNRTDAALRQVETFLRGIEGVQDVTSVSGYSFLDGLSKSNSGFAVVTMVPSRVGERRPPVTPLWRE